MVPSRVLGPIAAMLALLIAGCDRLASAADETIDADQLPTLGLEEELRIGSVDDPDKGFSRIGAVQVAPDGTVYVLESQDREVRVYDPQGALIRKFGGPGEGPGELQSPLGFQLVGDTVVVSELSGNVRVTLFTTAGEVIATVPAGGVAIPIGTSGGQILLRASQLRKDGRFDAAVAVASLGAVGAPDSVMVPRIVFDRTGAVVDTVGFFPMSIPRTAEVAGTQISVSAPLTAGDLRSISRSDTFVVNRPFATDAAEGVFTVTRVAESGDTLYRTRVRYTPVAVEGAYRDSVLQSRVTTYERRVQPSDLPQVRGALESTMQWPAFFPPVSQLRISSEGGVWLRRESAPGDPRWTVLSADGSARGQMILPANMTALWSDAERVWMVVRDDFEVPWLVRFRITGGVVRP